MLHLILLFSQIAFTTDLKTTAELSGFKKTGRYAETAMLCKAFEKQFPRNVKCEKFGTSSESRDLLSIVLFERQPKGKPVVLFQGGIHAGEIDGKDAGFLAIKEILEKKRELLKKTTLVFVPIFNVDGHERFGAYNRPNQFGPEEMGWRTTALNLNLNRDYIKAETPEMRAMHGLLGKWDPILYLDLHVTDGAEFQHDISVIVNPALKGFEPLRTEAEALSKRFMRELTLKGSLPVDFYPSFIKEDEPQSGFEAGIAPPRFSQCYWGLHQRIGVLVETHSWKPYPKRVEATKNTLLIAFESAAQRGSEWETASKKAREEAANTAGKPVVLHWEASKKSEPIAFQGYRYERSESSISGTTKIRYFNNEKEVWTVPFFSELVPELSVVAPIQGYWVPKIHASWMQEKLKSHGVVFKRVAKSEELEGERFLASQFEFGKQSYEGRQTLKVKGEWKKDKLQIETGSLFIPIHQPNSILVMHLLEPLAADSYLAWGFFNAHFEKKEYMENYVAESIAEEMLKDPHVKQAFEEQLKDGVFKKDPEKRLEFFYRRHPSWDARYGVYPVLRN